jgi:hypothetical protein
MATTKEAELERLVAQGARCFAEEDYQAAVDAYSEVGAQDGQPAKLSPKEEEQLLSSRHKRFLRSCTRASPAIRQRSTIPPPPQ